MRNGNSKAILFNLARVESFLSDVLENPNEHGIIIGRLTLEDVFIFSVISRDDGEGTVGNSFLFTAVLLVNIMFIRVKNNFLITSVMFAKNLVDDRDKETYAIIHECSKTVVVWSRRVLGKIRVRVVHLH